MDTKTENYWRILQNTLDMSRHADSKATAVLSICGILVSIGFTNTEALFNSSIHAWVLGVMILLPGLTIMISVYYSFRSIHPRIIPNKTISYLFFGSIARDFKDAAHYYRALQDEMDTEHGIKDDLAQQIYINAQLANQKFKDVMLSIRYFAITIAVLLLEFIVYLMTNLEF